MIATLISVALIVALVLMVRRPFARQFGAKAAYALWALPVARLVLPPIPDHLTPLGWAPSTPATAAPATELAAAAPVVEVTALPMTMTGPATAPPVPAIVSGPPASEPTGIAFMEWLPALGLVATAAILTGAVILIARQVFQHWQFMRLVRMEATPASAALTAKVEALAKTVGLRRTPRVQTSLLSSGPLVTGLARPIILLPAWFEADYSDGEQHVALMHELMHLKRGDLVALQVAHIVAALQWFNPLTWRALRAFRADQEAACDADVLACGTASPRAYGATLLKAIRQANPTPKSGPSLAAGLPLNHDIKDRFLMLDAPQPTRTNKRTATAITLALGTAVLLGTAGTVSAQNDELDGGNGDETVREFIIESDMRDRQLIILDDPMEKVSRQLSRLNSHSIPTPPLPPVPPLPPQVMDMSFMAEMESLSELAELQTLTASIADAVDVQSVPNGKGGFTITIETSDVDTSELEALIEERAERWAEDFEAHAERWGESFEADMERWAAQFEAQMDAYEHNVERMTHRAEALAHEVERITESEDFQASIDTLTDMRDACKYETFASGDVAVIETDTGDKAICIKGGRDRLTSEEVEAAVKAHPALSEAEKRRWLHKRAHDSKRHISID